MGSAHAESEMLSPETIDQVRAFLQSNPDEDFFIIQSSSGESCVACHAKEEIFARSLVADGLIKEGRYIVNFGATYEQTRDIARFNDLVYLEDMQKGYGQGHIKIGAGSTMPEIIKKAVELETRIAVLTLPCGKSFSSSDDRTYDLMQTAEVAVIRQACTWQKQNGANQPWDLQGAILKTMCPENEVGPLTYAEALWANIGRIETFWDDRWSMPYSEASNIGNRDFFDCIAQRPYNQSPSALNVMNIADGFANRAQYLWREQLDRASEPQQVLYNGAKM